MAHISVLKVFEDLGIKPYIISGSSMGSLVGAIYASGVTPTEMEKMAQDMSLVGVTRLVDIPFNQNRGLVKGNKIRKWLEKVIKVNSFEELDIPLKVVATDFWNRRQVVFDKGDVVDAVRASISIPVLFRPHKIEGAVYVDGGLFDPVPYDIIRDHCDVLIGVNVLHTEKPPVKDRDPSVIECLLHSFEMLMESAVWKDPANLPDIMVDFQVKGVNILNFHKYAEVKRGVSPKIELFRKELIEKVGL